MGDWYAPQLAAEAEGWIRSLDGEIVLNVAGNSERTAPGIERAAERCLRRVFANLAGWTR